MAKSRRTRIVPGKKDRERLERIGTNPQSILKHVHRADIILHLDGGPALSQTMRATCMSKPTARRWWDRFLAEGVDCLLRDTPGKTGRKPISEEKVGEAIGPGSPVHVILENVSSRKSAEADEWLKDHEDQTFHFTPAPASWMNAVEGFFSKLTRQRLKHAVLDSVDECVAAIEGHIEHQNATCTRPIRWCRKPEDLV